MSTPPLAKQYRPAEVEAPWIRTWLSHNYFHVDEAAPTVPYSMTLPPPNVTGSLHMGHALGGTIQDTLIRWKRMHGYNNEKFVQRAPAKVIEKERARLDEERTRKARLSAALEALQ